MKLDLVKCGIDELKVTLNDLEKSDLENLILGLKIELTKDYESFTFEVKNVPFERIRRITGYLVGSIDRFNDAKKAEEKARIKHWKTNE